MSEAQLCDFTNIGLHQLCLLRNLSKYSKELSLWTFVNGSTHFLSQFQTISCWQVGKYLFKFTSKDNLTVLMDVD